MKVNTRITLLDKTYWQRFYEILPECETQREAYERLEDEVEERHGVNRYTSYESFKARKSQIMQTKKKNQ